MGPCWVYGFYCKAQPCVLQEGCHNWISGNLEKAGIIITPAYGLKIFLGGSNHQIHLYGTLLPFLWLLSRCH